MLICVQVCIASEYLNEILYITSCCRVGADFYLNVQLSDFILFPVSFYSLPHPVEYSTVDVF